MSSEGVTLQGSEECSQQGLWTVVGVGQEPLLRTSTDPTRSPARCSDHQEAPQGLPAAGPPLRT